MGCDIHSFAEVRNKKTGKWQLVKNAFTDPYSLESSKKQDEPFGWRNYSLFGFLAGVRNYSYCTPLSLPRGIPSDVCDVVKNEISIYGSDGHSGSFLTLRELCEFDYDTTFEDRRIMEQVSPTVWNGRGLAEQGKGEIISYRNSLGKMYFIHLEELKSLGDLDDVRVVFFFDN